VARVDFNAVHAILLMYNIEGQRIDTINLVNNENISLATLTLNNPIYCEYKDSVQHKVAQYLLAGVFTGDLCFI
jgi:hypothetical protein